jgi:hypothetical protein
MTFIWILGVVTTYFVFAIYVFCKPLVPYEMDESDRFIQLVMGALGCVVVWPFFVIVGLAYLSKKTFFSGVKV